MSRAISIVSMIDVLMILLVFFMVTSTYMDLRMMPMAERSDASAPATGGAGQEGGMLLLVLGRDGSVRQGGRVLSPADLADLVKDRLATNPAGGISVLPSGQADTQALVALLDTLTQAGAAKVQVLRLEAP